MLVMQGGVCSDEKSRSAETEIVLVSEKVTRDD